MASQEIKKKRLIQKAELSNEGQEFLALSDEHKKAFKKWQNGDPGRTLDDWKKLRKDNEEERQRKNKKEVGGIPVVVETERGYVVKVFNNGSLHEGVPNPKPSSEQGMMGL
jgi:hypothetical protein